MAKLYGSNNNLSQQITALYAGTQDHQVGRVAKLYGSTGTQINSTYFAAVNKVEFAQAAHDAASNIPLGVLSACPFVSLERTAQNVWRVYMKNQDGSVDYYAQFPTFSGFASAFSDAFTWATGGQSQLESDTTTVGSEVSLFNDSVSTLIYQGFRHINYN